MNGRTVLKKPEVGALREADPDHRRALEAGSLDYLPVVVVVVFMEAAEAVLRALEPPDDKEEPCEDVDEGSGGAQVHVCDQQLFQQDDVLASRESVREDEYVRQQ